MVGSQYRAASEKRIFTDGELPNETLLDDFRDLPSEKIMMLYAELRVLSDGCEDCCCAQSKERE